MLFLALVALGIPLALSLRDRVNAEVRSQARSQAEVISASAAEPLGHSRPGVLRGLIDRSARSVRGRVIVVDKQGRVLGDSAGAGDRGASYRDRPEVAAALAGKDYQQQRHSNTLGEDILATSVPILHNGRPAGAVRITQSVAAVNDAVRTAILDLVLLGSVVLALGLLAGALLAGQIARPIRRLENAARRVAGGDLEAQAPVEGSTEQRSLARSFNEMTTRVSRLLSMQKEFVADASHQLRTPLTGVRLQLEDLRETTPDDDPRAAQLDAGMHEVDRLAQIVDELLILSRAGEHELPGENVDIERAVDRAFERWRKTAAERGIELRRERAEGAGSTWCSVADLDRVLDSLLENAIRYAPEGSEIEVASAPGHVEILDRGPGLQQGEEESVFERFYRGSAGRQHASGTGLGLSIARELSEQWNGHINLRNRPGGGAVAALELPRARRTASVASR